MIIKYRLDMILRQATIKYKGYDPDTLKPKSSKKVCCSCDKCGKVRWVKYYQYKELCHFCSLIKTHKGKIVSNKTRKLISDNHADFKGKNNPNYGRIFSKEFGEKISKANSGKNNPHFGKFGKNAPNWRGGISHDRSHLIPEAQCIKLNSRFNNSEFHHITKSIGVYIPKILHKHLYHSLKSGQGMGSINLLSLQFINGEL